VSTPRNGKVVRVTHGYTVNVDAERKDRTYTHETGHSHAGFVQWLRERVENRARIGFETSDWRRISVRAELKEEIEVHWGGEVCEIRTSEGIQEETLIEIANEA
jgi:hypothetical protein